MSNIDEVINEVYVSLKENFSFFELDDLEIYKLIKKCIGKNKEVTKDLILKKINKYFSKEIFKQVLNNDYEKLDNFFENEFEARVNMKKYILNQLPTSVRRAIKKIGKQ